MNRKDFERTLVPAQDVAAVASRVDELLSGKAPIKSVSLVTGEVKREPTLTTNSLQREFASLGSIHKITHTVQCVGYTRPIVFRKPLTNETRDALLYDGAQVAAYYRLTIDGVRYTHSGRVRYNAEKNTFHFTDAVKRSKP